MVITISGVRIPSICITMNIINKRGKQHHQTMSNTVIVLSQLGLLDKWSPPNRTQSEEQEHKGRLYSCNRKGEVGGGGGGRNSN